MEMTPQTWDYINSYSADVFGDQDEPARDISYARRTDSGYDPLPSPQLRMPVRRGCGEKADDFHRTRSKPDGSPAE